MRIETKKYTLKTGQEIQVRSLKKEDAQGLIDLKLSYIKHTKSLPMYLDEYKNKEEDEAQLIKKYNESGNSILIAATINGQLIGNLDLSGSARRKMGHTAMLGMGIHENWRNKGLGAALISAAIDWAADSSDLEIIWLDVYANNDLGFNLYKKMGFTILGTIKGFFKEGNNYYDKIHMYRRVK